MPKEDLLNLAAKALEGQKLIAEEPIEQWAARLASDSVRVGESEYGFDFEDGPSPFDPRPITLEELDRLEKIHAEATSPRSGYCTARGQGCSCRLLFLTPNISYQTYNSETLFDMVPSKTKPNTYDCILNLSEAGEMPKKDIICFVEAKNALPELIRLARIALTKEENDNG